MKAFKFANQEFEVVTKTKKDHDGNLLHRVHEVRPSTETLMNALAKHDVTAETLKVVNDAYSAVATEVSTAISEFATDNKDLQKGDVIDVALGRGGNALSVKLETFDTKTYPMREDPKDKNSKVVMKKKDVFGNIIVEHVTPIKIAEDVLDKLEAQFQSVFGA
jgi:hypothetical protein